MYVKGIDVKKWKSRWIVIQKEINEIMYFHKEVHLTNKVTNLEGEIDEGRD